MFRNVKLQELYDKLRPRSVAINEAYDKTLTTENIRKRKERNVFVEGSPIKKEYARSCIELGDNANTYDNATEFDSKILEGSKDFDTHLTKSPYEEMDGKTYTKLNDDVNKSDDAENHEYEAETTLEDDDSSIYE